MDTSTLLNTLIEKKSLSSMEAEKFLGDVIKGRITPSQISAILTALRIKGEAPEEIVGLIRVMRENMVCVQADGAIDVCGTGGDGSGSFNISTAVAFVVAGAGVKVAKHGNRAASSRCGSADVLEELGVNVQLTPIDAQKVFNKVGMVFLFAPLFHPAMKNVVAVRKELKIRTVFNLLGPFTNPASVTRQFIGVPDIEIAKKLADASKELGYQHLLIVASNDGLDEISLSSKSTVFEVKKKSVKHFTVDPKTYGFKNASQKEILGGSARQNAKAIREVLQGKKSAKRDIVVFNTAFALLVAGTASDIHTGITIAEKTIDSGAASTVLENLVKETKCYA